MSSVQMWIAFGVVLTFAMLIFGLFPVWIRLFSGPETGPPPVAFDVTVEADGPGGSVWYREGPHEHRFDWESAGKAPSIGFVHVPTYEQWPAAVPWAPDRREQILERVMKEVRRQKCPGCRWEIDETVIHFYER